MKPANWRFKAVKSVCQRCMERCRIPLDPDDFERGDREPLPWTEEDEERWSEGLVHCPQSGRMATPARKYCLCSSEVDAMHQGLLSVWDEKECV